MYLKLSLILGLQNVHSCVVSLGGSTQVLKRLLIVIPFSPSQIVALAATGKFKARRDETNSRRVATN